MKYKVKLFMISKFALVATASLVLLLSFSAHAATVLTNSGGLITGATGVDVGGTSYDVAFLDGSCNSLFDGCTNFTFTTGDEAEVASYILFEQVLTMSLFEGQLLLPRPGVPSGLFLTLAGFDSSLTGGAILVPWAFGDNIGPIAGLVSQDAWFEFQPDTIFYAAEGLVYAIWTPSAVVPLPAAAWLFMSAIAGLAGAKRLTRSKRTA